MKKYLPVAYRHMKSDVDDVIEHVEWAWNNFLADVGATSWAIDRDQRLVLGCSSFVVVVSESPRGHVIGLELATQDSKDIEERRKAKLEALAKSRAGLTGEDEKEQKEREA